MTAQTMMAVGRSLARAAPYLRSAEAASLRTVLAHLAEARRDSRFVDRLHATLGPLERRFARQLAPAFAALGPHVAQAAQQAGGLLVEADDPTGNERDRVQAILNTAGLEAWRDKNVRPVYTEQYLGVARQVVETVNTELGLGVMLPDPAANRVLAEGGRRAGLVDLAGDTRRALFRTIARAREEGLGPRQIGRLIRSEVPAGRFVNAGPSYRADLIARTETLHAQRFSSLEVYRAADQVEKVMLHDGRLGDTDAECEARDGREVSFDDAQAEMVSGRTHPQCTLSFSPLVRGRERDL